MRFPARNMGCKNRLAWFTALLVVMVLVFVTPSALFAQETAEIAPPAESALSTAEQVTPIVRELFARKEPIQMEAGYLVFDNVKKEYRAENGVTIRQGDISIRADNILVDMESGTIFAEGGVLIENPDGRITADVMAINLDQQTGVVVKGRLVVHQEDISYFLTGERIEKIGDKQYRIQNGTYTTCRCKYGEAPDWFIEAEEITVTLDGFAVVRHAVFHAFENPAMFLPYGVFPAVVSRKTGFLYPNFGWASDDGYNFSIPFYWAMSDWADATLYSDWYEKRGVKEGLEIRYAISPSWKGQFDIDYMLEDRRYGAERWAIAYEHKQNIIKRLYLRSKINMISDNDYVVDFPRDITARYDRSLRSNVILNNLWENFDLNVQIEHYRDLSLEDNSYTWQKLPEATFEGVTSPIVGPFSYQFNTTLTRFYRNKITPEERSSDQLAGHERPYTYLTDGYRFEGIPTILAPLSFHRYAYLTPFITGLGTTYYLPQRTENISPSRVIYQTGADLHTELERIWPIYYPKLRGLKHSMIPGVEYLYYPDVATHEDLPIFDGRDRHITENTFTAYFENKLWMKWFSIRTKRFSTFKLADLRFSQSYDYFEATRDLRPGEQPGDRRPLSPVTMQYESLLTTGDYINQIVLRSNADYNVYDEKIDRFNIRGQLNTVREDLFAVEYRYQQVQDITLPDIDYISGEAMYTFIDYISLGAIARYSFVDRYFIERIYTLRFNSLQDCWFFETRLEQRELPEKEMVVFFTLDLTGLVSMKTAY